MTNDNIRDNRLSVRKPLAPSLKAGEAPDIFNRESSVFDLCNRAISPRLLHSVIPDICNRGSRVFIFFPGNLALL